MNINNQIEVNLFVNGQEIPLSEGMFHSILINQHRSIHVPMCQVTLYDSRSLTETVRNLTDGSLIGISINTIGSESEPRNFLFRLFNIPQSSAGPGGTITMTGTLDCVKYFRGLINGGKFGTSSEVLQQLANESEIGYQGVNTDDKMFWLAGNTQYCKFARSIASYGYVDSNSIMSLAMNEFKVLRYVNLSEIITKEPKGIFWQGVRPTDNDIPAFHVKQHEVKSQSGLLNNLFNYGARIIGDTMDGVTQALRTIRIPVLSPTLEINQQVKEKVGIVRQEFLPPESGNQHRYWNQARNQNSRGESTFGMRVHVTVYEACRMDLFDLVRLDLQDETGGNQALNGEYIITAKTRCIKGNIYIEKYELCGQGRANDAGANLLS
jgi:hypothetical protein